MGRFGGGVGDRRRLDPERVDAHPGGDLRGSAADRLGVGGAVYLYQVGAPPGGEPEPVPALPVAPAQRPLGPFAQSRRPPAAGRRLRGLVLGQHLRQAGRKLQRGHQVLLQGDDVELPLGEEPVEGRLQGAHRHRSPGPGPGGPGCRHLGPNPPAAQRRARAPAIDEVGVEARAGEGGGGFRLPRQFAVAAQQGELVISPQPAHLRVQQLRDRADAVAWGTIDTSSRILIGRCRAGICQAGG